MRRHCHSELPANVGDEVTPADVVAERAGQPVPAVVAQLPNWSASRMDRSVPGGYVRWEGKPCSTY